MAPTTDVVFWDFDGTLATSTPLWGRAARAALQALAPGHGFDLDALRLAFNRVFPWQQAERAHHELGLAPATWWAWMEGAFQDVFVQIGAPLDVAHTAARQIKAVVLDVESYRLVDGAGAALAALSAAGMTQVILSNHVPELPSLIADLALHHHFAHILTSAAVGYEKPHPEIFAHALRTTGATASRAWMVGDNPVADLEGARRAGIRGILVGSMAHTLDATQHRAGSLAEVAAIILAAPRR